MLHLDPESWIVLLPFWGLELSMIEFLINSCNQVLEELFKVSHAYKLWLHFAPLSLGTGLLLFAFINIMGHWIIQSSWASSSWHSSCWYWASKITTCVLPYPNNPSKYCGFHHSTFIVLCAFTLLCQLWPKLPWHSLHPENFPARLRSTCHMVLQQLLARQEAIEGVFGFLYVCQL